MCGLFVVLTRARQPDIARAVQATGMLAHRGPDGTHHHVFDHTYDGAHGAVTIQGFLGHTRLSILDPDERSDQPFRRAGHSLVYNGEVYNFRALRADLVRQHGQHFETEGDTEVLLALLKTGGLDALHAANGMWAFCLLDEAQGQLLAARDRFGKKPLFFHADSDSICLASEIAPILHYRKQRARMRSSRLHAFLRHGWLFPEAEGDTHLEGIREVRAGGFLRLDLKRWQFEEGRWFDLDRFSHGGMPAAPEFLADTVEDAVRARLVADRPVGLLLSGGVDSSLVLSVLRKLGRQDTVTCFTGDAGKSDDAHYARLCTKQLGILAVPVPLDYGGTGMSAFLDVCRRQEKPFPFIGNVLAMPQMYARIAAHGVPVVLDGTGGDEIFAGYWDRYLRFAVAEAVARGDADWLRALVQANADDGHDSRTRRVVKEALAWAYAGGSAIHPSAAAGIVGGSEDPEGLDAVVLPEVRQAMAVDPLPGFRGTLAEALVLDATAGRLPEWLWQNDRNAMAHGIENRSPLLDHRLIPWMRSDARGKFSGPWNKHELRALFAHFVPLPTQARRDKQGFRWVYSRFLRHNRDQVLQLVSASRLLAGCVRVGHVIDAARRDERWLECSLLQRMLCIAGLEETMGLGAPA